MLAGEDDSLTDLILVDMERAALVDLIHALAATVAHDLEQRAPKGRAELIMRVRHMAIEAALEGTE